MARLEYHNTAILGPDRAGKDHPVIEIDFTLWEGGLRTQRLLVRYIRKFDENLAVFDECVDKETGKKVKLPSEGYKILTKKLIDDNYCERVELKNGKVVGELKLEDYDGEEL